jgi:phosphoglycolate phosphatase-like HAD superfamily hydrolase
MRKLILFDIDGTLLQTNGAGRRAIHQALLDEAGTAGPIDTYRLDGKTDPQIVGDLLSAAGHPAAADAGRIAAVCRRYVAHLKRELDAAPGATRAHAGIPEILAELRGRTDATVGLLTGNVVDGARLKLAAAGIDFDQFVVGAFGSDHGVRAELPPIASRRAAPIMGRAPTGHDVVIIGDTPADVTCGNGIGARALGVGTGKYSREDLMQAGAYAAFATLERTDEVLTAIYA